MLKQNKTKTKKHLKIFCRLSSDNNSNNNNSTPSHGTSPKRFMYINSFSTHSSPSSQVELWSHFTGEEAEMHGIQDAGVSPREKAELMDNLGRLA